jgi:hypothetical protein
MTHFLIRNLKQEATYWGNPVPDGWGGLTFDSPVEISCRWEDKTEMFTTASGKEAQSSVVVFLGQDVDIDGFLYLGSSDQANPKDVAGAYQIKAFKKIPGIRATYWERKAWL